MDAASRAELTFEELRLLPQRDEAVLGRFYDLWFDRLYGFVRRMVADGVDTMVECGAGAALVGMVRRIAPEVRAAAVSDTDSLEAAVALMGRPMRASA